LAVSTAMLPKRGAIVGTVPPLSERVAWSVGTFGVAIVPTWSPETPSTKPVHPPTSLTPNTLKPRDTTAAATSVMQSGVLMAGDSSWFPAMIEFAIETVPCVRWMPPPLPPWVPPRSAVLSVIVTWFSVTTESGPP